MHSRVASSCWQHSSSRGLDRRYREASTSVYCSVGHAGDRICTGFGGGLSASCAGYTWEADARFKIALHREDVAYSAWGPPREQTN